MKNKGLMVGLIIAAVVGIGVILAYYSYDSTYITLNNNFEAQDKENRLIYDEVWKVVQQQAGVSEQYAEQFKSIYVQMMDARYENGGEAFKWIKEQNPQFDASMYKQLMSTIEAERIKFTNTQRKSVAIQQEMKNLVQKAPARWFIGSRPIPELQLVTSTKTDRAFTTGKEDDVDLFPKK